MSNEYNGDDAQYAVVVNDQEQYTIWTGGRELPLGWYEVGMSGTRQECLQYIDAVWTDMRPFALRKLMGCGDPVAG